VRSRFGNLACLQYQDLVAIVDSSQPVGNKDASTALLLQNAVDVLQQSLFSVGVEGRSLFSTFR